MRSIKSGSDYIYTTAFKTDTNTAGTGLTPALTMYKLSDSSVIINAQNMTEVALGIYKYTIPTASLVTGNSYAVYVDGGATLTTFRYQYDSIDVDKMPTVTENVTGILDAVVTSHTTADTVGEALNRIDTDISTAGQGNGGITQPIYVNDTDGTREGGVKVEIFSNADMAETNRLTGNIFTDDAGQIVVNLNAGTYYLRASKSGKTFSNPITITVVA
jgi:hypothetical protein